MCAMIPATNMSREEWLRLRKSGIGGSDAGAICGLNPYSSPIKVYQDKISEDVSDLDNESMRQGCDLEDYVARRFMEATGLKVRRSNMLYRSEEHPCMIADVDRLIVGEDAGLECKTASAYSSDKWKDGQVRQIEGKALLEQVVRVATPKEARIISLLMDGFVLREAARLLKMPRAAAVSCMEDLCCRARAAIG